MIRGLLVTLVVLLLVAGAAGAWMTGAVDGWLPRSADTTVPATAGTIDQRVVAIGKVEPVTEVTVANKIAGRIKAVLVKEGSVVAVGQPLIRFEGDEYESQVRIARARVTTAEAGVRRAQQALEASRARLAEARSGPRVQEIEVARADLQQTQQRWENLELERMRSKRLYEASLIARSEYERSESESQVARARIRSAEQGLKLLEAGPKPETVASAQAQVQEAEAELRRAESQVPQARAEVEHMEAVMRTTVVQSSVHGKVTRKLVEPGEAVDIGAPLLVVGDTRKIIVKAEVDETDIGKLAIGQTVSITADAFPGRVFPGTVYEIGETVGKRRTRPEDPTRMQDMKVLETKIEVTDGAAELKLGMTVDVKILVAYKERALVIPKRLVPAGAREATVRVVGPGGGSEPRVIKLGMRDDEKVEVTSGLAPGDRVLLASQRK
jgi:ABC exporter DevB family membrane fusion protein